MWPHKALVVALASSLALLGACSNEAPPPAEREMAVEMPPPSPAGTSGPLVVEASRPPQMMIPVLDAWRSETDGRFELVLEDATEPAAQADVVILDSLGDTWDVAEADELRPVFSDVIDENIDARLRDSESRWTALAKRGRVVVYNASMVSDEERQGLQDYEALREARWRDRLCLSSSSVGGNRLLVALLLSRHDIREAELIVREWRANLARPVLPDDGALLEAVADGTCVIAIADSNDAAATEGVSIHWFDNPAATLVDVTTAGVSRHAADPDRAAELLAWLTTETPNALFAIQDLELPANPASPAGNLVRDQAARVAEPDELSDLGFLIEEADRLVERAGYP